MAEMNSTAKKPARRVRHKGRQSQILIYLGKQFRFFINQSDWKVIPMAAVIAGLVAMVIRRRFFVNMEGSLIGAFALCCVAIWNGCFNSIQSVCRERPIVKREHRSGMHISAYVAAHMIYQFLLCLAQTGVSLYVMMMAGVPFPAEGFMTPWMIVDLGITMLLISYASDMMSLFISSISHTTTAAMTVMPFVLIFQLVFSGGIIPLPAWSRPLSNFTISNYGIKALAAQSGYNEYPMVTAWNTLAGMKDSEIGGTFTIGQVLNLLDSEAVQKHADEVVVEAYTIGEAADIADQVADSMDLKDKDVIGEITLRDLVETLAGGSVLPEDANDTEDTKDEKQKKSSDEKETPSLTQALQDILADESMQDVLDQTLVENVTLGEALEKLHIKDAVEEVSDTQLNEPITVGMLVDLVKNNGYLQSQRDREFTVQATVGDLFDLFGEENIKSIVQEKTRQASYNEAYARTASNITEQWLYLGLFIIAFALLSTIALELIDRDKR